MIVGAFCVCVCVCVCVFQCLTDLSLLSTFIPFYFRDPAEATRNFKAKR